FFFNTFSPEDVGIGGEANRRSWGEGSPFTGYTRADRPAEAARLCVVVANPNHSVIPGSESCFPLPDLPSVELTGISLDDAGSYVVDYRPHEFEPEYPGGTHLHFYFNTYSPEDVGIGGEANRRSYGGDSPFADYTAAERPEGATGLCAIVAFPNHSVVPNSGDCIHLPDVLQVEITSITLDADNRYVVEYATYGFTSSWPGTHVHFYFDTVTVEELRQEGSTRFSHGGASPYSGYSTADRPANATQLCAIVATADNEHLPDSGTCFPLPDVEASNG
ncbi:MAG TPA: hypothetical protein VLC95_00365, partial [Anaerolineae bacterium]|nr:hypothetical protein [Anaerolineae bacterium]